MAARRHLAPRSPQSRLRPLLILAALVVAATSLMLAPSPVRAYGNLDAHPEINKQAVEIYLQRAFRDEWLSHTSLDGRKVLGTAVIETGLLQIKEDNREMTVAEWLAHGGMSADEPELPASFRHFYDPLKNSGVHYLTDHLDDVLDAVGGLGSALVQMVGYFMPKLDTQNPKTDAKQWAFTHPDNRFSYAKAVKYYRDALAVPASLGGDGQPLAAIGEYGLAWRAVGETMHLMADMTVPAHVRNDSHPDADIYVTKIGNPDPYESTIGRAEVLDAVLRGSATKSVDYGAPSLPELFEAVARWTNANFYSGDTIQCMLVSTTANGEPAYPSPTLDAGAEKGYYYREIDGQKIPMLATSLLHKFNLMSQQREHVPWGYIDWRVLQAQRRILIPTAVEASSRVIDDFLPRFMIEYKVKQVGTEAFEITGNLVHKSTKTWPQAPQVNNGAFLSYKPKGQPVQTIWVPWDSYQSGNAIRHRFEAPPGGVISLGWDLGGYVIKSDPVILGGVELNVLAYGLDTAIAHTDVKLQAVISDVPAELKTLQLSWSMGDGGADQTATLTVGPLGADYEIEHAYTQAGEYTVTVWVLHPQTGEPLAEVTRKAVVKEVKVQIYPNRITGRIGFPIEASCLPSQATYRYEWIFGDGESVADGTSVVQHAYRQEGTYDLTVRVYQKGGPSVPLAEDKIKVEITGSESECPWCGHVHGPFEQIVQAKSILFRDGNGKQQCVYQVYFDTEKTQLYTVSIYVDGKREGVEIEYWSDGNKRYERTFVAGIEHGVRKEYSPAGLLSGEREYRNGREEGILISYNPATGHKTGEGTQVFFADTNRKLRHGPWISYDPTTGVKAAEGNYEYGLREGRWTEYHALSGELEGEGNYVNDKRNGTWTHYDKTGKYKATGVYGGTGGHRQGTWTEQVSWPVEGYWKGEYVDGRKTGTWVLYRPDGSATQHTTTHK